ncbi:MAG: hypothetical protein ACHREM_14285 [Polyangiales bacterium]
MNSWRSRSLARLLAAMALLACSSPDGATSDDATSAPGEVGPCVPGATFTAYNSTFADFHSWPSSPAVSDAAFDSPHTSGPMTEFINRLPPVGSTEFPVGTVIVKETNGGDPTTRQIFAMVKSGGCINADGAIDWLWYQLANEASGTNDAGAGAQILWRGVAPPAGTDPYLAGVSCNGCHVGAATNDFVWSTPLQLSRLEGDAGR